MSASEIVNKVWSYAHVLSNDDIFWLKDESLEDTDNLPAPAVLAAEIVEQLEAALEEFRSVEEVLAGNGDTALDDDFSLMGKKA